MSLLISFFFLLHAQSSLLNDICTLLTAIKKRGKTAFKTRR